MFFAAVEEVSAQNIFLITVYKNCLHFIRLN